MFYGVKDIIKDSVKSIERIYEKENPVTGIPTGFRELDRITSGMQPGDLVLVCGKGDEGKTAFVLDVAYYVATAGKTPVLIFSLGTVKEQIGIRLLCARSRVDISKVTSGKLSESDWPKIAKAAETLNEAGIFIDDTADISVGDISEKVKKAKAEIGAGLIIIDHIQLLVKGCSTEGVKELQEVCRELNALAKELKLPIVAVSQLSYQRGGSKGPLDPANVYFWALAKTADLVIRIERIGSNASVTVEENRRGGTGTTNLSYFKDCLIFEDVNEEWSNSE